MSYECRFPSRMAGNKGRTILFLLDCKLCGASRGFRKLDVTCPPQRVCGLCECCCGIYIRSTFEIKLLGWRAEYSPGVGLRPSFRPFFRSMPFSPSFSDIFDKELTFRLVALGNTRNLNSLSLSVGRSSNASNSVPSPYVLCRLGRRNTLGAVDGAAEGV